MSKNAITVAVDVYKGIAVQARGKPAEVVAYAAAGAIIAVAAGVGYGAFQGARAGYRWLRPADPPADDKKA